MTFQKYWNKNKNFLNGLTIEKATRIVWDAAYLQAEAKAAQKIPERNITRTPEQERYINKLLFEKDK